VRGAHDEPTCNGTAVFHAAQDAGRMEPRDRPRRSRGLTVCADCNRRWGTCRRANLATVRSHGCTTEAYGFVPISFPPGRCDSVEGDTDVRDTCCSYLAHQYPELRTIRLSTMRIVEVRKTKNDEA